MSSREPRAPAAFRLSEMDGIAFEEDAASVPAEILAPVPRRRRGASWGKLFLGALGALVSFAIGVWAYDTVAGLFGRQDWLGWTALGLAVLVALGALGWALREAVGLLRLRRLAHLRDLAAHAEESANAAERLWDELDRLYRGRADLASARRELARHRSEIIDPPDRVALAEGC